MYGLVIEPLGYRSFRVMSFDGQLSVCDTRGKLRRLRRNHKSRMALGSMVQYDIISLSRGIIEDVIAPTDSDQLYDIYGQLMKKAEDLGFL